MTKAPDQSLYDHVFLTARDGLQFNAHVVTPDEPVTYPLLRMGWTHLMPRSTKTQLNAEVTLILDIWGNIYSRNLISSMARQLLEAVGAQHSTIDGYAYSLLTNESTIEMLLDDSTNVDLWRAHVTLRFYIN